MAMLFIYIYLKLEDSLQDLQFNMSHKPLYSAKFLNFKRGCK
ncbi:MAG: hypothetical protein ACJAUK_000588 [Colwellia polaris]|jgi:hypothetical protein